MWLFDFIKRKRSETKYGEEFCPRCDANLTLQKGYDNNLPYWVCKGCGEMWKRSLILHGYATDVKQC